MQFHALSRRRQVEGNVRSVQEMPLDGKTLLAETVDTVADDGMANGGEVDAYLMGAARNRSHFDERVLREVL